MKTSLNIAIAEDEPELRTDLEETLHELGHRVAISAADGESLVEAFRSTTVDLVITDIKMPGLDGLSAAEQIRAIRPVPIIILSAFHDEAIVERALKEHVLAYLVKPIQVKSLQTSIEIAVRRFKEFQSLQEQAAGLQQALEDRKIIERAKGILMERAELSEPDAFRRLQLLSSQKNQKLVDVARRIVDADSFFQK
jgi:response regulator NasT